MTPKQQLTLLCLLVIALLVPMSSMAQTPDDPAPAPIIGDPYTVEVDSTLSTQANLSTQSNFTTQSVADELEVIRLTNNLRKSLGTECLRYSSELTIAARLHAQDMHDNGYFSHTGLNGSTPRTRANAQGYAGSYIGENIAAGSGTPQGAYNQWYGSSGHYNNMINGNYHEIGVGYYSGPNGYGHYWVMVLARRTGVPGGCKETNPATNLNNFGTFTSLPSSLNFTWTHDTTQDDDHEPAENYRVVVQNGSTVHINQSFTLAQACSGLSCSVNINVPNTMVNGNYKWWVEAISTEAGSKWSDEANFAINVPPPVEVPHVNPANNAVILDGNVTISWTHVANATWYYLLVYKNGVLVVDQWLEVGNGLSCSGTCSYTAQYANGSYTWWIQGYGVGGTGPWGSEGTFRAGPPPPSAINKVAPTQNATLNTAQTTITWTHDNSATWYRLMIYKNGGLLSDQWLEVGNSVTCGAQCSINRPLGNGNYTWWIMGWNSVGNGAWGTEGAFSVTVPAPNAINKVAPTQNATLTTAQTTFTWTHDNTATWYRLMIYKNGALLKDQWLEVGNSVTCGAQCSTAIALGNGNYSWWIMGWNAGGGNGNWGTAGAFSVNVPAPSAINKISPTQGGTVSAGNISFSWTHDNNASWYYIQVYKNGQLLISRWFEVGNGITCSSQCSTSVALTAGNYTWWIRGWNAGGGNGDWGTAGVFTVN